MSNASGTSAHLTDDVFEALVMGELSGEDRLAIRAHLEACDECREVYGDPEFMLASLPFVASEDDVAYDPAIAWSRIADRLTVEPVEQEAPRSEPVPISTMPQGALRKSPWHRLVDRGRVSWMMAASIAGVALILGLVLGQLLPDWRGNNDRQSIPVKIADSSLQVHAVLTYLPQEQVFVLDVTGMPPAPDGYVYQAWLIDPNGPVPSGVMGSGQNQLATHGDKAQFTTFAITLEPGPLGAPAPTSNPILVAELTGS